MKRIAVLFIAVIALSLPLAFAIASPSVQATPTNLPETGAPATATPRQFCHVQYLVFVRPNIKGVNVRPTPSKLTTPYFTVNGTQNPQSAIGLQDGWFELCSIAQREYIINDPTLVTYATVTPSATPGPTLTRLVTNTPSPQPSATATATPDFDWISIDTDHDGFLEYSLRCESPCTFVVTNKEPSGIIQVSVTEWPTRSPTP